MTLRPFWRYYGAKWRAAPRYPKPLHDTIVEPFAGAAGYSLRYPERNVILVEKYPAVAELWRYLIAATAADIESIPTVDHVDELPDGLPDGARLLVGFCLGAGQTTTRRKLSAGLRRIRDKGDVHAGWSPMQRARAAAQVSAIRHWRVIEGDFTAAPDIEATWFVDPPYQGRAGSRYRHGSSKIDYAQLAQWSRTRPGQVIVCESYGADWLPFIAHALPQRSAMNKRSVFTEAIWTNETVPA